VLQLQFIFQTANSVVMGIGNILNVPQEILAQSNEAKRYLCSV